MWRLVASAMQSQVTWFEAKSTGFFRCRSRAAAPLPPLRCPTCGKAGQDSKRVRRCYGYAALVASQSGQASAEAFIMMTLVLVRWRQRANEP